MSAMWVYWEADHGHGRRQEVQELRHKKEHPEASRMKGSKFNQQDRKMYLAKT